MLVAGVAAALVVGSSDKLKPKAKTAQQQIVNTACGPYRKDGVMTINNQPISVEIAYTAASKAKGLGGRPCIQPNQGMLFDFGKDGHYAIWMKDMKFPIDVIWISSEHKIAAITIDFKPSTYDNQNPQKSVRWGNQIPARYVLEVKANTAKQLHLALGMLVHFQKS